ncbi:MAG: hypothetical protein R2748_23215 [Bryobacterales bacterium]
MTPRFQDVPEHWKYPEGPYRQAPVDYGGQWWLVNPFGSAEPWVTQSQPVQKESLPEGFEEIFGGRPKAASFRETPSPSLYFRMAVTDWEQSLRQFVRAGMPEWAPAEMIEAADKVFEAWGMGRPRFYEGRYGWSARFPDSEIPEFECAARSVMESAHLVVAQYQLALLERGETPATKHPFVPPQAWPSETSEDKED